MGTEGDFVAKNYERRKKEKMPVIAICYDFDKTLSPDDMQAQGYIQSVGYDVDAFWKKTNELAENNNMDQISAYMLMMTKEAEGNLVLNKGALKEYGAKVKLFPGVKEWFERIRAYGREKGVIIEHYIISSGIQEMIEGTSVAKSFEKIYACSFYYNERGVAKWPAQIVNYTNKTQFLFRIEKGVLDVNDAGVNDYFSPEDVRVPFRNMVYIGDSDTDVPCMKLVNSSGGFSIGVYNSETKDRAKVYKMMRESRIKYFAPADYSEGSELDILLKNIIDRTVYNETLESVYYRCKNEYQKAEKENDEEENSKIDLIIDLENSGSFARTHDVIKKLSAFSVWTNDQIEQLCLIAVENSQIYYILKDEDISKYYKKLLKSYKSSSKAVKRIKEELAI